jgi:iron complex transport system substrate-binding protein
MRIAGGMSEVGVCALCLVFLHTLLPTLAHAAIAVRDDTGRRVSVAKPAQRIISLAPHVTELLFAAGAGALIVGTPEYSDYPKAAKRIPRIGNASGLDLERIVALRPDLIVAWQSGNPSWVLERILQSKMTIFLSEPRKIEDIASNLERLGLLTGNAEVARRASRHFLERYHGLQSRYAQRPPVTVFYQVWSDPLMTINGAHLISSVIRLCGGVNVFADLPILVPRIGIEAVLQAQPQVIVAAGAKDSQALAGWRKWPQLQAVRKGNLFLIPYDEIARHTPRVLDGAERLCIALDQARSSP